MLHLLLFLLFLAPLLLIFRLLTKHPKNGQFHPPPGPKGLPLIGNLHQYDSLAPHVYFSNLAKIYGPILYLRLGRSPTVVIQSAMLAKEVLQTQDSNFCNRPSLIALHKLSYNGLDLASAPYNDYFRKLKKICVVHLLSSNRVQSFAPIRQDEVSRMINRISYLSSTSNIVNLNDLLMVLASSHICRIAFGKRYEDERVQRSRFHDLMVEMEAMFGATFYSEHFPLVGCWFDKLTGLSSRLERVFKDLDAFLEEIINDHFQQDKRAETEGKDIIDVLLQLQKEPSFEFEMTIEHIKGILMDIFVGGTNSSVIMIIWAMTELMKNPKAMKKVQNEIRTKNSYKSLIEQDDLPQLEYLKAVVKETFRLHPSDPLLIAREAITKCKIQGYDIMPKTLLYVNAWAIGRDPELWDDPEKFMPERFLASHIDYKGHDFELIPFGAGRRICPGISLCIALFELALANLLYFYDWELPIDMEKEDIDTDILSGIAMYQKNPLCLIAKKFT